MKLITKDNYMKWYLGLELFHWVVIAFLFFGHLIFPVFYIWFVSLVIFSQIITLGCPLVWLQYKIVTYFGDERFSGSVTNYLYGKFGRWAIIPIGSLWLILIYFYSKS